MGDTTIAQDLIDGVADAMATVGDTKTIRIVTEGSLNPSDPGAGKPRTPEDLSVEAFLYDFEDEYVDGTTVLKGDRKAIIDLSQLTSVQIAGIKQGHELIDGSESYKIVAKNPIEVSGLTVTIILHIRGAQ